MRISELTLRNNVAVRPELVQGRPSLPAVGRPSTSSGRTVVLLTAVLLSACHSAPTTAPKEPVKRADLIACATGDAALAPACAVDLAAGPDGQLVTVRNPDGGFHRLLVTTDGRGLVAADGAQAARVTPIDANTVEVAIGADRYRLPATVARR